jgi:hypothetical protein
VITQEPQHDGQPLLDGFIERRTKNVVNPPAMLLRVWCRWCCRWHQHGLADGKPGQITHRSAHCIAKDSTYSGYYIRITATSFAKARKMVRKASDPQRAAIARGRISPAVQRLRDQPLPAGDFPEAVR